jgi:hypothetical protein
MKTKTNPKTNPGQCDLHGLANRLHTDPHSLRRALNAAGVKPSACGHYDSNKASFAWLAAQVKESPTRTIQTNISVTSEPR